MPISGCGTQAIVVGRDERRRLCQRARCPRRLRSRASSSKAVYSGDANFAASTSAPVTQVVNQASTSTTISVDTNPSVSGETVNYTATSLSLLLESTARRRQARSTSSPPPTAEHLERHHGLFDPEPFVWDSTSHTGSVDCATAFAGDLLGGRGPGRLLR